MKRRGDCFDLELESSDCKTSGIDRTYVFVLDLKVFDDQKLYDQAYFSVSKERLRKTRSLKKEEDRKRSIGAEWLLLKSLKELGILEKNDISYSYGEKGKPYLNGKEGVYFNLSHSGEKVLCVISPFEVGCDIEQIKGGNLSVARHFFCESEFELITKQETEEEKRELFYRFWTLKESFLKATGLGMSLPLNSFEIVFEEGKVCVKHSLDSRQWYMKELELEDGYRAALCGLDPGISRLD